MSTNQLRILGRLRSRHAPRPNYKPYGPPLILQLQRALQWLQKNRKSTKNLQSVEGAVLGLERLFNTLENQSTDEATSNLGARIIRSIIFEIHSKLEFSHLSSLLYLIPSKDSPWPGTPPDRIVRKFRKLSQYVSAAAHLRCAVRIYSNWEIEEGGLPYPKLPSELDTNDEAGFLTRSLVTGTMKQRKTFQATLEAKLNKSRANIETEIQAALREDKPVHAEIQLLYHYIQHPHGRFQPRVLISNKECCYLCNLFIQSHGQYYTPRSHGAFYSKWRLPTKDEVQFNKKTRTWMNQIFKKFNDAIEKKIQSYLQNGIQKRIDPSESTLISTEIYTPTVTSTVKTKTEAQNEKGTVQVVHSKGSPLSSPPIPDFLQLGEEIGIVGAAKDTESLGPCEERLIKSSTSSSLFSDEQTSLLGEPSATQSKSKIPLLDLALSKPYLLSFGCATVIRVASGTSARFETPNLHFDFYRERPQVTESLFSAAHEDIVLRVEWLSNLSSIDRFKAVNLEALDPNQQELVCDDIFSLKGMVFHGKGHSILIRARISKRP